MTPFFELHRGRPKFFFFLIYISICAFVFLNRDVLFNFAPVVSSSMVSRRRAEAGVRPSVDFHRVQVSRFME